MFGSVGLAVLVGVILTAAVVVPVAIYEHRAQMKREALGQSWAAARGCNFSPTNPLLLQCLRGDTFPGGFNARVHEYIEGKTPDGRTFCSFMYVYEESSVSESGSSTVDRAIVMVRLPTALPSLSVTLEGIDDKVQKILGGQDIELESEEFNRLFRIESPVEGFAYGVLHPRMMEWLMRRRRSMVPFVIEGQDVICFRFGKPDYAALDGRLADMCDFIDQIPQGVFEKYAAPSAIGW